MLPHVAAKRAGLCDLFVAHRTVPVRVQFRLSTDAQITVAALLVLLFHVHVELNEGVEVLGTTRTIKLLHVHLD